MYKKYYGGFIPKLNLTNLNDDLQKQINDNILDIKKNNNDIYKNDIYNYISEDNSKTPLYIPSGLIRITILTNIKNKIEEKIKEDEQTILNFIKGIDIFINIDKIPITQEIHDIIKIMNTDTKKEKEKKKMIEEFNNKLIPEDSDKIKDTNY